MYGIKYSLFSTACTKLLRGTSGCYGSWWRDLAAGAAAGAGRELQGIMAGWRAPATVRCRGRDRCGESQSRLVYLCSSAGVISLPTLCNMFPTISQYPLTRCSRCISNLLYHTLLCLWGCMNLSMKKWDCWAEVHSSMRRQAAALYPYTPAPIHQPPTSLKRESTSTFIHVVSVFFIVSATIICTSSIS